MRIERDERDLRIGNAAGVALFVPLADKFIDIAHADLNSFCRCSLQLRIERGIDAQRTRARGVGVAQPLHDLFVYEIHEVGCLTGVDVGWREVKRLGLGTRGFSGSDCPGLDHRIKHYITALGCPVRMPIRVAAVGVLDESGDKCTLIQVELTKVFAKVGLGSLAKAVDGVRAALADIDLIRIHLEDLRLAEASLELERNHQFSDFARDRLLRHVEDVLGKLLRNRGTTAVQTV